jgi:hypothetical protein
MIESVVLDDFKETEIYVLGFQLHSIVYAYTYEGVLISP